jgi:phage-related holin
MPAINFAFLFDTLHTIFVDGFWNKMILGTGAALMHVLFDFSLWSGVEALGILVCFHFILGIINAVRKSGWSSINLSKANATPTKVAVYGILISSAYLTEKALGGTDLYLDQMVIGFLAVAEFREILRHAAELGYILPKVFMDKINNLFGNNTKNE